MSTRLWFHLDDALALAEDAAAASILDTGDADAVDEPALILVGGDGICLRSDGLPAATAHRPTAVYPQGAPAHSGQPQCRDAGGAGPGTELFLPLHPTDHDGLLRRMRRAAADGQRWLVASFDADDTSLTLSPRHTLQAHTHDNARWIPATVRIFGILGPHPAQIADGYSWFGWLVPRFTAAVVDAIIADLDTIAEACPPGQVDVVRRRDDTVEIITAAHTAAEHVDQVHADADGTFTLGAYRWCWESADPDPTAPSGHASTPPTGRPVCLCPRRCVLCGEPLAGHHNLDCGWSHGSREGESPHLAREPRVLSRHIHQPGCRHAQRHPGGLFEQDQRRRRRAVPDLRRDQHPRPAGRAQLRRNNRVPPPVHRLRSRLGILRPQRDPVGTAAGRPASTGPQRHGGPAAPRQPTFAPRSGRYCQRPAPRPGPRPLAPASTRARLEQETRSCSPSSPPVTSPTGSPKPTTPVGYRTPHVTPALFAIQQRPTAPGHAPDLRIAQLPVEPEQWLQHQIAGVLADVADGLRSGAARVIFELAAAQHPGVAIVAWALVHDQLDAVSGEWIRRVDAVDTHGRFYRVARRRTIDIVHGPDPGPDTDVPTRALLTNLLTASNVDTTATQH